MTIQEQADAILAGWNQHRDAQDELMARLAKDRDALLKAAKALVRAGEVRGCFAVILGEPQTVELIKAIKQAES